jgi:hemoglobin
MNALIRRTSIAMLLALASFSFISTPAHADEALYNDFGGKAGLVKIADDLMTNVLADPRTRPYFEEAPQKRIKEKLAEQLCVLLDGPCTYTGRTMKRAHEGLGVTREAFNALVENLQKAMDKNNVPFRSQNKLLAKLAPMYRDIEERNQETQDAK